MAGVSVTREELIEHFCNISDEELLERAGSGELTTLAQSVADAEIKRRGIKPPKLQDGSPADEAVEERNWVPVTAFMYLKEADVIERLLHDEGIPATQASPNSQRSAALNPELATAQVLVPKELLGKARRILADREKSAEK